MSVRTQFWMNPDWQPQLPRNYVHWLGAGLFAAGFTVLVYTGTPVATASPDGTDGGAETRTATTRQVDGDRAGNSAKARPQRAADHPRTWQSRPATVSTSQRTAAATHEADPSAVGPVTRRQQRSAPTNAVDEPTVTARRSVQHPDGLRAATLQPPQREPKAPADRSPTLQPAAISVEESAARPDRRSRITLRLDPFDKPVTAHRNPMSPGYRPAETPGANRRAAAAPVEPVVVQPVRTSVPDVAIPPVVRTAAAPASTAGAPPASAAIARAFSTPFARALSAPTATISDVTRIFARPVDTVAVANRVSTLHSFWQAVWDRLFPRTVPPVPDDPEPPVVTDPEPEPPAASEPELLWESNFDSIEQAQQHWRLQEGRWGEPAGENQYYTGDYSNVWVTEDGVLVIEARRETPPDGRAAPDDYTSARVVTYERISVEPNTRIVARMKMPYTEGTLPAFWMVGEEPGHEFDWPRQGEIDIVELPGFGTEEGSRTWTGSIHGPAVTDNTVDVKLEGAQQDIGVDLSADFHEYGIDWYEDQIIWHVDGVEVGRITREEYEAMGGDWTPFSGAWPHYLIMNVAVGNPWTGDPDPAAPFEPQQLQVDWVRVYALEQA